MKIRKRRSISAKVAYEWFQRWATPNFDLVGDDWVNQHLIFVLHNKCKPQFKRKMK